jgi:hypothetical protein
MIDQMLSLHPSIPYLHMGCDEVYYRLVHPQCVNLNFRDDADLFIRYTFIFSSRIICILLLMRTSMIAYRRKEHVVYKCIKINFLT